MTSSVQPLRVLHVVSTMDRGGVETWLVNVLRSTNRDRFHFDFVTQGNKVGAYDEQILSSGGRIIPVRSSRNLTGYARDLWCVLGEYGPYDVVHSHLHHFSALILALAKFRRVPVRIAHSHNDLSRVQSEASLTRKQYYRATEWIVDRTVTKGLACSADAAQSLFGRDWKHDHRFQVLNYGVDFSPFEAQFQREETRNMLGLPDNALVLGNVASLTPQKNHSFLLRVFQRVLQRRDDAWLVLVGTGPLTEAIKVEAIELGVTERVVLTGARSDIPRILVGAMDCFVFPSNYEGLGIALVEAQAAGLPIVISDAVPKEAEIIPALVTRLSLDLDPAIWAEALLSAVPPPMTRQEALHLIKESRFDIAASVEQLSDVYEQQVASFAR